MSGKTAESQIVETEKPKTTEELAEEIEREKQAYKQIQPKFTADLILNDLNEIFQEMFVWYIDNITYEYIFTDEKNRKERYEKKKVVKEGGKIKYERTNIKKSFDTNLKELESDVEIMVDKFENRSGLFSLVEYDDSWYDKDSRKPKSPPASAKELYVEENLMELTKELSKKTMTDTEKKEQKDDMIQKLNEQWIHLDESNREIYKRLFFKTKEKKKVLYEETKQNYLENKRIEMTFIPYYYRYFIVIYQQIYSKYFTYDYIKQGKNTNLFIRIIIVIMSSLKMELNDTNNVKSISDIIKLLYGFMYKIEKITNEQHQLFEKIVLKKEGDIQKLRDLIEELEAEQKKTGELSSEQEEEKKLLLNQLGENSNKLDFLANYSESNNMITQMAIERLNELMIKYKKLYFKLELVNKPSDIPEKIFREKMEETVETVLFFFQTFLKENNDSTDSFHKYISNAYENIYLVQQDMIGFLSLKKEFDQSNLREEKKGEDAASKAGKAAAVKLEALKKVEETKKCEICGKTGKANFSKAQWGKPITESRKCKECVLKQKGREEKKASAAAAAAAASELFGEEEEKQQREKEKAKQKAEKVKRAEAVAEQAAEQALTAVDMKEKKTQYETSIKEIDELLNVINKLKYDGPDSKMFSTAHREDAETKFKRITNILNDNGFGKLVMVGNFSIYKLMEHVIGTDLSKIGIATDDIDGKICLKPTDESLDLIRKRIIELLNKEKILVKLEEERDGNDPNTPIKILSSVEERQIPGMRPIPNRPIIDITFDVDSNDKRCETQLFIDNMFISDAQSTLQHYLDIFSSLKKDDNTYNEEMIKEISKDVKLKAKRGYEYTIPLWKSLINKAKQEDGFYERKGFSINKEMFPLFLKREGIQREALQEFIAKLASFEYKLPSWKGSLERLKLVFEKLLADVDASEAGGGGSASQGGRRKTRKRHTKKKRTYKKSKRKKNVRKTLNHWKRKTLKRKKKRKQKRKQKTRKRVKRR